MDAGHAASQLAGSSSSMTSATGASGAASAIGTGRARAGTLPSTFHLLNSTDSLLAPNLNAGAAATASASGGDAARPDLLRRRLSGLPMNSTSSTSATCGSMTPPLSAISSILRESQPVSPDPVAAARLRSGSLTLPPSGLGNAFTPGVFGPPGSFTPRSTGLGTPLGMPTDGSAMIPEEAQAGSSSSARLDASSPEGPQASAILDFLGLQDNPAPRAAPASRDQTRLRSPSQPPPSSLAMGNLPSSSSASSQFQGSSRRISPPGTASSSMSTGALLVPGRLHSGSLSVPSSCHPSIANLRQTYQDHSGGLSSSSGSSHSGSPDGLTLSPASAAARLRANTLAADALLRSRPSSSFQFSPSLAPHDSSSLPPPMDPPTRTLADLSLEVEAASAYDSVPGVPSAHSSAYLLNRPRASTFSILDESANPHSAQHRKRAGTTAAAGLLGGNSLLRTPLYEGSGDGYLDSAPLAETEEVKYIALSSYCADSAILYRNTMT